ncbi:SlyX family protein [Luteimonas vadosa]|uniref:Protein SlyX homolog n=1 Tax=Luteimonas vadosa TaxID=1165507 RepID=A0ABP9E3Q6_9GAMM
MVDELEQRVVELETRLAFQEQAIAELSDALAQARLESANHARRMQEALDDLKHSGGDDLADPAQEPPPPHY